MSYARFIENDVYVFLDVGGYFNCCMCSLGGEEHFYSTDDILTHLREHLHAGDHIDSNCFDRLEADRGENDSFIQDHGRSNNGSSTS